jgi:sarcosine oxidase
MSRPTYDAVVVGLGVMGGAVAHHLARRGMRVLALDRHRPPHAHGSSHGRTRVIRAAYFEHASYVPLVRRAYELWRALPQDDGDPLLRVTGAVVVGHDGSTVVQGSIGSAREHEIPHEVLSADDLASRFPALRPEADAVGVWEPGAGALRADACVEAQLRAAAEAGADLRFDDPVSAWRGTEDGVEVQTSDGSYSAGALVVAAGAWTPALVRDLPLRIERQVQIWFRPGGRAPELEAGRMPVFLWDTGDGRLFYGIPDFGDGLKTARHHGGASFQTPAEVPRDVSGADVDEVRAFLRRRIPGADSPPVAASVCLYTNTPSHHFLVDRHSTSRRVWIVSACSGHGFKFAPAIGEAVAAWVESDVRPAILDGFSFQRASAHDPVDPVHPVDPPAHAG